MRAHRPRPHIFLAMIFLATCLGLTPTRADVKLPTVIGSHMVLQRDKPIPIWGWADAGEKVTVSLAGQSKSTTAGPEGEWKVVLDPVKATADQKGQDLVVKGKNSLTLENILIGEVWLCSGQSNMEQGMGMIDRSAEEIAAADHSNIRLFLVPKRPSGTPMNDVDATWRVCSPTTVTQGGWSGFSGVAYFFGRKLHEDLGVPVGLIESSWGGTRIEPWTPPVGFASVPALADLSRTVESAAPGSLNNHGQPTGLYNGMIHPLVPFAIRGAIWYQGESNMGEGMLYHEKMKALIAGWRTVWGQDDRFPFYFVQLAPFQGYGNGALPRLWEAQTATLSVPNTGMSVTTDITGNMGDIHPRNKQDVGKRLALWALARTYKMKALVYSGPLYRSMKVEGDSIRLSFAHTGSGLKSRDGQALRDFSIAGSEGPFVPAEAKIEGNTVVVHADAVAAPVKVTFGWFKTANPNLCNVEGLPAAPFNTENWQGSTGLPAPPAIVYGGKPFTVENIVFKPKNPAAKWGARLHYRASGSEKFASVPASASAAGEISATIPGEVTKTPLEYYLLFDEAGQPTRTEPPEGAEEPLKLLPDLEPPTAVGKLEALELRSYHATIQWEAATDDRGVARYGIFRGDQEGFEPAAENEIGEVSSPSVSFTDPSPPGGKSIWYAVRAFDEVERAGAMRYLKSEIPANQAPENQLVLTALAAGTKAFLKWSGAMEPDVTAVELLRGEGKDGELKLLRTIDDLSVAALTDEGLAKDAVYRYAIRPRDRGNLSGPASRPLLVQSGLFLQRINCGGDAFTGADGIPWEADSGVVSGTGKYTTKSPVTCPAGLAPMFTTERWANSALQYKFAVEPGRYAITLYFAETNPRFAKTGKRIFDVEVNGEKQHEAVDVFAKAGVRTAWTLPSETLVDPGSKQIVVELKKVNNGPALKGIEVRGLIAQPE